MARMETDCNLKNSGQTFQVVSVRLQIIDINDRGLFAFCELRLYLPLDIQRKCYEWIKYH